MRYRLLYLLLMLLPFFANAQKAYDAVKYKGTLQDKTVQLYLGNGYLAASKITLSAQKQKPTSFLPESGAASDQFILRNTQNSTKDLFILYHIRESYNEVPLIITGSYQFGKKAIPVKFYLVK